MPAAVPAATGSVAALPVAGGIAQTVLSLLLVLAAIFALAWVLRRVQGLRPVSGHALQVQGGVQVGPKERVLWLRAGDAHLLIGVAPGQVRTLHVFDHPPQEIPMAASGTNPGFLEALRKAMQGNRP